MPEPSKPSARRRVDAWTQDSIREWALGAAVTLAFIAFITPRFIHGRYVPLEVSLAVLAIAACAVAGAPKRTAPAVPIALVALLALMGLSAAWSFASWDTLRDVITYAVSALAAWIIVRNASLQTIVRAIVVGGLIVLAGSLVLLIVDPGAALYYGTSGLQGLYGNRNTMGIVITQALPAALVLATSSRGGLILKVLVIGAFLVAIAFTLSRTSWLVAAVTMFVWGASVLIRRNRRYLIGLGLIAVAVVAIALANFERVLTILGKDATLNGRIEIWGAVASVVPQSPIVGFGWSRSWPVGSPHSAAAADALNGHVVFHAHNEILNWLVTTGMIGVVFIISLYGFAFWAGAQIWRTNGVSGQLWMLLAAVTLAFRGLSDISETNAQGWFIFMLVLFACSRYLAPGSSLRRSKFVLLPVPRPGSNPARTNRLNVAN